MSKKALLVQVTIYDTETKAPVQQIIEHCDGSFSWEVERLFRELGEKLAPIIDPDPRS
jgi:hypothetical protein